MRLLHDSEKIKARYECKEIKVSTSQDCPALQKPSSNPLDDFAASFSYFRVPDQSMASTETRGNSRQNKMGCLRSEEIHKAHRQSKEFH